MTRLTEHLKNVAEEKEDPYAEEARKLRNTFSRVVPNLHTGQGVAVFYCKPSLKLVVYSVLDGDMVAETAGATRLLATAMCLSNAKIPINRVDEAQMTAITRAFRHIREVETDRRRFDPQQRLTALKGDLSALKRDLARIFEQKYGRG